MPEVKNKMRPLPSCTPVVSAVRPVRPPASTPEADSIKVVTVLVNGTKKNQTVDLAPYAEVLPKSEAVNVLTHKRVKCADEMRLRPKEIRILDFSL